VAILVDATLTRSLLLPSLMKLLGETSGFTRAPTPPDAPILLTGRFTAR
jgi:hypothetical protein